MKYTLNLRYGTAIVSPGVPGVPPIWISLDDCVGVFRLGEVGSSVAAHVPYFGIDDAWHMVEESEDVVNGGAWWVRHVSWTTVEVEYRR